MTTALKDRLKWYLITLGIDVALIGWINFVHLRDTKLENQLLTALSGLLIFVVPAIIALLTPSKDAIAIQDKPISGEPAETTPDSTHDLRIENETLKTQVHEWAEWARTADRANASLNARQTLLRAALFGMIALSVLLAVAGF